MWCSWLFLAMLYSSFVSSDSAARISPMVVVFAEQDLAQLESIVRVTEQEQTLTIFACRASCNWMCIISQIVYYINCFIEYTRMYHRVCTVHTLPILWMSHKLWPTKNQRIACANKYLYRLCDIWPNLIHQSNFQDHWVRDGVAKKTLIYFSKIWVVKIAFD